MRTQRPGHASLLPESERQWCVYRCFDAEGCLLYVGSSSDVENRMFNHFGPGANPTSLELQRVYDHHTVTPVDTRAEALEVERLAIIQEAPLLNRIHNSRRWRFSGRTWVQRQDVDPEVHLDLHGTCSTYNNRGCRCDRCRAANRDASRERRRRAVAAGRRAA